MARFRYAAHKVRLPAFRPAPRTGTDYWLSGRAEHRDIYVNTVLEELDRATINTTSFDVIR